MKWTVTTALDAAPAFDKMGFLVDVQELVASYLAKHPDSKKPDGPAPASLLDAGISMEEYEEKHREEVSEGEEEYEEGDFEEEDEQVLDGEAADENIAEVKNGDKFTIVESRITNSIGADDEAEKQAPTAGRRSGRQQQLRETKPHTIQPAISVAEDADMKTIDSLVCPVPDCNTLANRMNPERKAILRHLRDYHHIDVSKYSGRGGNMGRLGIEQETAIRAWLRQKGHATDSAFFVKT